MTIDEAIKHCEEVAEANEAATKWQGTTYTLRQRCAEQASDYKQIAEWLKELKELRNSVGAVKLADMKAAQTLLSKLLAADVQPERGYWKATMMSEATGWDLSLTGGRDDVCEYNCSVCGQANILDEFGNEFLPPYCPFCGAEMENPKTIKG